ncbi:bifunctional nicotinamidase/pyrazinamidase [Sphingobacterium psychroaquaticum]|uniref:Nicotinamidase n=1 Tax=Sphingobacterium psychroaquaticum TaxID=561061 RepID=A0A1X7KZ68_9SPHI|nr:bifunctional nicotinamidase/pyrazinamidase [Sphingobacterium psychroaquaticum]SMG46483.1 nicotinamidase/pyrazinamidase [Sphingobacterium psychroaquaticum]
MKALIIVDMQYDFLPGGNLAVAEGDQIIPVINSIQQQYDVVVATQDWHPLHHISFASQHPGKKVGDVIEKDGKEQALWPDHCVQGTRGAALSEALDNQPIAAVFRKGMDPKIDSYSGFFDNGQEKSTGLSGYLKNLNIDEVHVCGLAADYCVYFTALDSLSEGFNTVILEDATRAIDAAGFEIKKEIFTRLGGEVQKTSPFK